MKNKYNIGDKMFYIERDIVRANDITGIFIERRFSKDTFFYSFSDDIHRAYWIDEALIFPSKEKLLASL